MMIAIMFGTRITVIYVSHHDEADGDDGDDVESGCPPHTSMLHIDIHTTMMMVMMLLTRERLCLSLASMLHTR